MTDLFKSQLDLLAEQMAERMQPFAEMQKKLAEAMAPTLSSLESLAKQTESIRKRFDEIAASMEPMAKAIARTTKLAELIQSVGLLPHTSMPVEILESDVADVAELRQLVKQFYENSWQAIAAAINQRIGRCDIDDEAKATMREALLAHEQGHYRSVCRLLLPEIERVARVEFKGNAPGSMKMAKLLVEKSDDLSVVQLEPSGYHSLILVQRLTEHLYEQVDTRERREKFEDDPVPNRHAAIHGIIVYNSIWNSLNVIFLTDIAFQVVSLAKRTGFASGATGQTKP
jgi:hypothetical protein